MAKEVESRCGMKTGIIRYQNRKSISAKRVEGTSGSLLSQMASISPGTKLRAGRSCSDCMPCQPFHNASTAMPAIPSTTPGIALFVTVAAGLLFVAEDEVLLDVVVAVLAVTAVLFDLPPPVASA